MPSRLLLLLFAVLLAACDSGTPGPGDDPAPPDPTRETRLDVDLGESLFRERAVVTSGDRVWIVSSEQVTVVTADGRLVGALAVPVGVYDDVAPDGDGGIVILSRVRLPSAQYRLVVTRIGADLALRWSRQIERPVASLDPDPFYPFALSDGAGGRMAVFAFRDIVGLDLAEGDPLWVRASPSASAHWFGGAADAQGVTVVGRDGATLLAARLGWDGATVWNRTAAVQAEPSSLLVLGAPLAVGGGDVLVPYALRRVSSLSGVLRLSPSGDVVGNWTYLIQLGAPQTAYYSRDGYDVSLAARSDGTVLVRDRRPVSTQGGAPATLSYVVRPDGTRADALHHFVPVAEPAANRYVYVGEASVHAGTRRPGCAGGTGTSYALDAFEARSGEVDYQLAPATVDATVGVLTATDRTLAATPRALSATPAPSTECNLFSFE